MKKHVTILVLGASLLLNLVLAGMLLLRDTDWGTPLPAQKPDLAVVEQLVRAAVAKQDFFQIHEIVKGNWVCGVALRHSYDTPHSFGPKLEALVDAISRQSGLPGRVAGWVNDPQNPARLIGSIIEFGYSPEVGYRMQENELIRLRAEKERPAESPAGH